MSENQKDPQYKLRWSEDLRNKITDAAKENNRSINAEITTRLEQSFETPALSNMDLTKHFVDALQAIKRIEGLEQEIKELKKQNSSI